MSDVQVLHEDCDPTLANDKKLPYSAYIVEYKKEDRIAYDISMASSQVLLFDHYYDKYKTGLKGWKQTKGIVNPKLWNPEPEKKASPSKKPNQKRK